MYRCSSILLVVLFVSLGAYAQDDAEVNKARKKFEGIYTYVEQMPKPEYSLSEYFSNNLRYPDFARSHNIEGRVLVKVVVNRKGKITHATIVKGIGGGCDEEAKRAVSRMPRWRPGKQDGKPVAVFFTLPITFKLTD